MALKLLYMVPLLAFIKSYFICTQGIASAKKVRYIQHILLRSEMFDIKGEI